MFWRGHRKAWISEIIWPEKVFASKAIYEPCDKAVVENVNPSHAV